MEANEDVGKSFGLRGILSRYFLKDAWRDVVFPLLLAGGLVALSCMYQENPYTLLVQIAQISLTIIPALISVLLAAYVFVMTFLFSKEIIDSMVNQQKGKDLLYDINASFVAALLVNGCSIVIFFIVYFISQCKIELQADCADIINYSALYIVIFFTLYSMVCQFGIWIDLFNYGQAIIRKNIGQ